jgi:hypothetical protein
MAHIDESNSFLQRLIAESRRLTEVNAKKCEAERVLKELTMFKNLSNVLSGNEIKEKVLKVSTKVVPNGIASYGSSLAPAQHEVVTITVQNISDNFSFNPTYWQFVINMRNGDSVSAYSVEKQLEPGMCETFSCAFTTDSNISPVQIKLNLIFSLKFRESLFVRTVHVSNIFIDILHLLSPGRTSSSIMYDSTLSPSESCSFSDLYSTSDKGGKDKQLPAVTLFFFHFDSEMSKHFLENVILTESICRGFSSDVIKQLSGSPDSSLKVFYQEEEITISSKPKGSGAIVSFKSANPKLLFALKVAVLRRLMCMKNVKVNSPDDDVCEKLYELKLRVEDLGRSDNVDDLKVTDLMDIYLELRDISEMIQFILVKDVE